MALPIDSGGFGRRSRRRRSSTHTAAQVSSAINNAIRTGQAVTQAVRTGQAVKHTAPPHIPKPPRTVAVAAARRRGGMEGSKVRAQKAAQAEIARQDILHMLKGSRKPLRPLSLIDPLTEQGRQSTKFGLSKTGKPIKLQPPDVVYDEKTRSLFKFTPPPTHAVRHEVKQLFNGNAHEQQRALKQLQRYGVVEGGTPKTLKYVGRVSKSAGWVKGPDGSTISAESIKPDGSMGGTKYYRVKADGQEFRAGKSARGGPITIPNQRGRLLKPADVPRAVAGAIHELGAPTGTVGRDTEGIQEAGGVPYAHVVRKGILAGGESTLGVAGDLLDRPLAGAESGIGKGLVSIGAIKGDTAKRIKHARGPLTAVIKGRGQTGVSGGDIVQGIGGPRQLGIGVDLLADPLMWVGVAALPESGGGSSALIAERIARKVGPEALKSEKVVAAVKAAESAHSVEALDHVMRALAAEHGVSLRNLGLTRADKQALIAFRHERNRQIMEQAPKRSGATITTKMAKDRRLLPNRDVKKIPITFIGKPGSDAIAAIARTVQETHTFRPGFRLKLMKPTGDFKYGSRLDRALSIPLPDKFPAIALTKSTREALMERDVARIVSHNQIARDATIKPMQEDLRALKVAKGSNSPEAIQLSQEIEQTERKFAGMRQDAIQRVETEHRVRQAFQSLGDVTAAKNEKRLLHQTGSFADEFGRSVQHRMMNSVMKSVGPLGKQPKRLADSLARVQLHLWAEEGATRGGIDALARVLPLNETERQVKDNLRNVYDEALRQGKDLGILGEGTRETYGGPRIWTFDNRDITTTDQVKNIVVNMSQRLGSNSFFQHHRTAPSIFDLADPEKLRQTIQKLSGGKVSAAKAREVADELWHTGKFKTRAELLARHIERSGPVPYDDLPNSLRYELRRADQLTPKIRNEEGKLIGSEREVPVFRYDPKSQGGMVDLNRTDDAQRAYGFDHEGLADLPLADQKQRKLVSALIDKLRLEQLDPNSEEAQFLRPRIEHEIRSYDIPARQLAKAEQEALLPKYGVSGESLRADALRNTKGRTPKEAEAFRRKADELAQKQTGVRVLPKDLKLSTVLNDAGVAYVKPLKKGAPIPPGFPPPRMPEEAGPYDNPFDATHHLPDMREQNAMPVVDPRLSNFYRSKAQGLVSGFRARWEAIDAAKGRSRLEADDGRVVLPDGSEGQSRSLRVTKRDENGKAKEYYNHATDETYKADDLIFPDKTLISDRDGTNFYDPITHQEYCAPVLGGRIPAGVGEDRLWPCQTTAYADQLIRNEGGYDIVYQTGMEAGWQKFLSYMRYGVTTPFPAYHVRNMISDLLKSLQADSGVLFHPIANFKLAAAASGAGKDFMLKIPGYGKMPVADFLLVADSFGLRSGHHVAEVYRLIDQGKFTESNLKHYIQNSPAAMFNPAAYFIPTSWQGAKMTAIGAGREDITRFMTFFQRMRSNGGDAADAAMYMIRHHFNYNDLSSFERRFMRNTFLFYTWYRKNIPLQFQEIFRRPGFFAGVAHSYRALERGETPFNLDWSQLNGNLPDLTGQFQDNATIPDYYRERLQAAGVNWNGHMVMFGFGAPWADLQIASGEGVKDLFSFTNPFISLGLELGFRTDLLTGREFHDMEAGPLADLMTKFGIHLPTDDKGRPVTPFWANSLFNRLPIFGRASGSFREPGPFRDTGRLQTLGRKLNFLTGINVFVAPEPGSAHEEEALLQAIRARTGMRHELINRLSNIPKPDRDRQVKKFDQETLDWAHKKRVPMRLLQATQNSGFYISSEPAVEGEDDIGLGGHKATPNFNLGGPEGESSTGENAEPQASTPKAKKKGDPVYANRSNPKPAKHAAAPAYALTPAHPATVARTAASYTPAPARTYSSAPQAPADTAPPDVAQQEVTIAAAPQTGSTVSGGTYDAEINAAATKHGVNPALLKGLVKQESGFNPNIGSPAGAQGLTQLMPATARSLGVRNIHDVQQNLDGGAKYLKQQLDRFGGNVDKALAAYNAGPGAVERFGGIPPYKETQNYVRIVKANAQQYGGSSDVHLLDTAPSTAPTEQQTITTTAPQIVRNGQVDESAAIVDALLDHKPGKSLLKNIMSKIDSGAYGQAGQIQVVPGSVTTTGQPTQQQQTAEAPSGGDLVSRVLQVGTTVDRLHPRYLYGGGHGATPAKLGALVDCSGFVSQMLGVTPRTSGQFMSFGEAGPGRSITIYAHSGHVLLSVVDPSTGKLRWFATSHDLLHGAQGGAGERRAPSRAYLSAFTVRHPKGY